MRRQHERQSGQAIVLIAVMITAMTAMIGLAVDSGRAYIDRRELQAAVDAGVLAAGDTYRSGSSFTAAEPVAVSTYAANERLYGSSSCSPAWSTPSSGASITFTCTWSSDPSHSLTLVTSNLSAGGTQWQLTASHSLGTTLMSVLGLTSITLGATATSVTTPAPANGAIITLDQGGCPGHGGQSLSISGSAGLTVTGDVHISGTTTVTSSANSTVSGNYYSGCGSPPSSIQTSGTVYPSTGPFADPGLAAPSLVGLTTQTSPGNAVNLPAGTYTQSLNLNHGCVFLGAGVWNMQSGFSVSSGFGSNKLRPPDEPSSTSNTTRSAYQFWDQAGSQCGGAFSVAYTPGPSVQTYVAYEVTAQRTDTYGGVTYTRESAPSMCRSLGASSGQAVNVSISNVPGATSYNVYAATSCAGPFGWAVNLPVTATLSNQSTTGCPSTSGSGNCTLGTTTGKVTGANVVAPSSTASPRTSGAYPPASLAAPSAAGLPDEDPPQGSYKTGDAANENMCANSSAQVDCSSGGTVTPGAVIFYVAGQQFTVNGGYGVDIFSGIQYGWHLVYQPCSNTSQLSVNGGSGMRFTGIVYVPCGKMAVTGSSGAAAPFSGQFIVADLAITGSGGVTVAWDPRYAPTTFASRLTL